MPSTIKLHTAPGSLQRIDKGIRDVDNAVMDLLALAEPHLAPEFTDSREFHRAKQSVLKARNHLSAVLAIELELEADLGPEPFEVSV